MRDRTEIEREMFHAREDLEHNLSELKDVIVEKVDIPARARHAIDVKKGQAVDLAMRGVDAARDVAVRGKDAAVDVYYRARETTRERPVLVTSLVLGTLTVGVLMFVVVRRQRQMALLASG